MKRWIGRSIAVLCVLAVLILAVGLAAPFIDANRFRAPLQTALEKSLQRKVEFREVRFQVFPAPGLTAQEVVIHEDKDFGLEPFAYVTSLQAGLRWSALYGGPFEVSSVRFNEASVNLARREDGGWNYVKLLNQISASKGTTAVPVLEIRDSRVNFRFGVRKSPFYFNQVDLDLSTAVPAAMGLKWSYAASPARTDRPEQGFGRFRGAGSWRPGPEGGQADITLELERSVTSEVVTLLTGRDLGLQGRLSSRARIFGPLHRMQVQGTVQFENLETSGVLGLRGAGWSLPYEGLIDGYAQTVQVDSTSGGTRKTLPLAVRLRVSQFLENPKWQSAFEFEGMPAPVFLDLSRRLGANVPGDLSVDGKLTGRIEYSSTEPLRGEIGLAEASVTYGGGERISVETATLRLEAGSVRLMPAEARGADGSRIEIDGYWSPDEETLAFRMKSKSVPVASLLKLASRLPQAQTLPVFAADSEGALAGTLEFSSGVWSGDVTVSGASSSMMGLSQSVAIENGQLSLRGPNWTLRKVSGRAGSVPFRGEVSYRAEARRPVRFELQLDEADASVLETLFRPTLARQQSMLSRAFRLRPTPLPNWLRQQRAEGLVRIGKIKIGASVAEQVTAKVYWDGAVVEIPDLTAVALGGMLSGRLTVRMTGDAPEYRLLGRLEGLNWRSGSIDAEFDLAATGYRDQLWDSLRVDGQFQARSVEISDELFQRASGCFGLQTERSGVRVRLRCLDAVHGADTYTGQGMTTADGRLVIELMSAGKPLRLAGSVYPVQLELVQAR